MRSSSKILALLAILVTDLLFFLFFGVWYPEVFEDLLHWLPWENHLERAILVISGLIIAVLTSIAVVYLSVKHLQRIFEQI